MNKYMEEAIRASKKNGENNYKNGGPFGAVIVKDNKILAVSSNRVLTSKDPTAHAEINAIRKAGQALNTSDLSGCVLYTSCYPCPMCLAAILWSNIKEVYYGNTKEDANEIGFRDDAFYEMLKDINNNEAIKLICIEHDKAYEVFEEFKNIGGPLY